MSSRAPAKDLSKSNVILSASEGSFKEGSLTSIRRERTYEYEG